MFLASLLTSSQVLEEAGLAAQISLLSFLLLLNGQLLLTVDEAAEEGLPARVASIEGTSVQSEIERLLEVVVLRVRQALILEQALSIRHLQSLCLNFGLKTQGRVELRLNQRGFCCFDGRLALWAAQIGKADLER